MPQSQRSRNCNSKRGRFAPPLLEIQTLSLMTRRCLNASERFGRNFIFRGFVDFCVHVPTCHSTHNIAETVSWQLCYYPN